MTIDIITAQLLDELEVPKDVTEITVDYLNSMSEEDLQKRILVLTSMASTLVRCNECKSNPNFKHFIQLQLSYVAFHNNLLQQRFPSSNPSL